MKGIKSLRQSTYKAMWSYCLKCSKYTENKIPQVVKAKKEEEYFYQDLSKSEKVVGYLVA